MMLAAILLATTVHAFQPPSITSHGSYKLRESDTQTSLDTRLLTNSRESYPIFQARRPILIGALLSWPQALLAAQRDAPTDLTELLPLITEARKQLEPVPGLLKASKWDSVRLILITPPLVDCWAKNSKPLLKNLASAIGDLPDGDEMAALEAREDAISHLQYLDMAVYNNVFSPIGSEGEAGATKALIKSYYEMPRDELAASIKALDTLAELGRK